MLFPGCSGEGRLYFGRRMTFFHSRHSRNFRPRPARYALSSLNSRGRFRISRPPRPYHRKNNPKSPLAAAKSHLSWRADKIKFQTATTASGRDRPLEMISPLLIVPTGTLFEPTELSGTQADSGSCPPVVFYASNRLISSISVICFVICGACSPSCIGLSTLPMSLYTILILCPAEREYYSTAGRLSYGTAPW